MISDERAIEIVTTQHGCSNEDVILELLRDRTKRIAECKREKQAVIAKISGWIDACDAILDFIRNPKGADGKMQKSKRKKQIEGE